MKRIFATWIFPLIAFFMFATMLIAMLLQTNAIEFKYLIAYSTGVLAYSLLLTGTFISSRPRFLEKHVGMPRMYAIHAVMTIYATVLVVIQIVIVWQGFGGMFRNASTIFGYIGMFAILVGMSTGMLSLSGMFVNNIKALRYLKEKVLNREVMLWVHRIAALVAVVSVYIHQYLISFLRTNTLYMMLLTLYSIAVLGYYAYWKMKTALLPRYTVTKIYKATPLLWVLEFKPNNRKMNHYKAGDYFFIRFQKGADITKEAHPFSASSAITKQYNNTIEFMIKEAGNWTRMLTNIKVGDIATLEGPYGDYFPKEVRISDKPYVLIGGGIGLTPNLSILRAEIDKESQRKIHLVWALSWQSDLFMLEELESYKKINPNFEYHIIFSNEKVEGYPFGFISHSFLEEIAVAQVYQEAIFFICGPDKMIDASRKVLLDNGVSLSNIHVDDFGF